VEFIESQVFTRQIRDLISDDSFRQLQNALVVQPESGALIQHTGGARKMRWATEGSGKSGGIRVIYFLRQDRVHLAVAYKKGRKDSLTAEEKKVLLNLSKSL
jgi:hypothetical protein